MLIGRDVNETRKKISKLTCKLQSQKKLPLWALAHENVIYSAAIGKKPKWGVKSSVLRWVMKVTYKIKVSDIVIFFTGICSVVSIWRVVNKNADRLQDQKKFKRVFAGFGASSEECLYAKYLTESGGASLRINWVTHEGLGKLGCPNLFSVFALVWRNAFGYSGKLKNAPSEVACNAADFLTVCAVNVGVYAFYRQYWKMAKSLGISEATFLTPDMQSFACVDEGIKTICLQHGLLSLSILFPKADFLSVCTLEEKSYLKASLDNIQVACSMSADKNRVAESKANVVLVLSVNIALEERVKELEPLLEWAESSGLKVVIRPTVYADDSELLALRKRFPVVLFDDAKLSLDASLSKWRPKIVVAWTSTGFVSALNHGCLPVSLCDPLDAERFLKMIYPMYHRILFWSRDKARIKLTIESETIYSEEIMKLQDYQDEFLNAHSLAQVSLE